ncbi:MAG: radical SAM protein [Desulfuromonadaceae bacterium]
MPCCANWINRDYGKIDAGSSLEGLWNGAGAQEIRRMLIEGRQSELCKPDCPWLVSGRFSEEMLRVIPGPQAFEDNQRLNNEEIRQRKTVLSSMPMAVRIIPTLRCNIDCRMCHQNHAADLCLPDGFMDDIRGIGHCVYDYQLHGGEVLIAPQFGEWVSIEWFSDNPQMLLSLVTNATHIPERAWEILQRVRLNYITVSLNAATREIYREIAGADLFEQVLANIKMLSELGKTSKVSSFSVYLSFVIMRSNYHEIPEFVRLANRMGLPLRLLLVVGDRNGESIYTDPPVLAEVLAAVKDAAALTPEVSRPEVTRVEESLECAMLAAQAPGEGRL